MTTILNDGSEFGEGDRVRITKGAYAGLDSTVRSFLDGLYYVVPDVNPKVVIYVTADYLALIESGNQVDPLKIGMTSDDLAEYVDQFIREAQARVRGVGDEQYSEGTHQKFEAMSLDELLAWAQEEVQDVAVYSAMLDIRLRRIRAVLKDHL